MERVKGNILSIRDYEFRKLAGRMVEMWRLNKGLNTPELERRTFAMMRHLSPTDREILGDYVKVLLDDLDLQVSSTIRGLLGTKEG